MPGSTVSVRFRFFTAFGLIVLLLWGAIAFALHAGERDALDRAEVEGSNLARSLAEHVASSVRAIDLSLKTLCDEWLRDPASFAGVVARQQAFLKDDAFSHVAVIGADGRAAWDSLPGWQGVDLSDRQHFKIHEQRGTRELYISPPLLGRVSKQWTIQFTRPIYDRDSQFAGVLVLAVQPPNLERVYNDIQLGTGGVIALVRSDGQILAHTRDLAKAAGVSLSGKPGLSANDPPAGRFRAKARVDGAERLYHYQKVRGYPLTVIVGQSVDTLLARYRAQRAIYLASGALATALLLALTLLLVSRRIDKEKADRYRSQLAAIVDGSNDAIVGLDCDARIVSWNAGAERLYGYAEAEALGQSVSMTVPPDRMQEFDMLPRRILQGEQVRHFETVRVARDGRRIDVLLCVSAVKNAAGGIVGISVIAQDINERCRLERNLRESAQLARDRAKELEAMLEAVPIAVFIARDPGCRFVKGNRAAHELLGVPAGANPSGTVPEHERPGYRTYRDGVEIAPEDMLMQRAAATGRAFFGIPSTIVLADGTERHVLGNAAPLFDADGKVRGALGVFVDISERKRAEEKIRRLNENLEQKVQERTRELERSNEELESFSYSVAHDLRTPLRGINGFSAILAGEYADKLDAAAQGYLRRIQVATVRMGEVMDDLLALAHAGKAELRRQEVDLSALAQAVAANLQGAEPQRQVKFEIAPGMMADADPGWLRIALDNLLGNAWKFTARAEGAKIWFGLTAVDGRPAYCVRDNGVGFDPAFASKLFEQFQRLHTDKEYGGSGVGLAIVARVICRHGGRIWAEGAPGQGASFYFTLA